MAASTEARMQIGYRGRSAGLDKPVTQDTRRLQTIQKQREEAKKAAAAQARQEQLNKVLDVDTEGLPPNVAMGVNSVLTDMYNKIEADPESVPVTTINRFVQQLNNVTNTAKQSFENVQEQTKDLDWGSKYGVTFDEETEGYRFLTGKEVQGVVANSFYERFDFDMGANDEDMARMLSEYHMPGVKAAQEAIGSLKTIPDPPSEDVFSRIATDVIKDMSQETVSEHLDDRTGLVNIERISEVPKKTQEAIVAGIATSNEEYFKYKVLQDAQSTENYVRDNEDLDKRILDEARKYAFSIGKTEYDYKTAGSGVQSKIKEESDAPDFNINLVEEQDKQAFVDEVNTIQQSEDVLVGMISDIDFDSDEDVDWSIIMPDFQNMTNEQIVEELKFMTDGQRKKIKKEVEAVSRNVELMDDINGSKAIMNASGQTVKYDGIEFEVQDILLNPEGKHVVVGYKEEVISATVSEKEKEQAIDSDKQADFSTRKKYTVRTPVMFKLTESLGSKIKGKGKTNPFDVAKSWQEQFKIEGGGDDEDTEVKTSKKAEGL